MDKRNIFKIKTAAATMAVGLALSAVSASAQVLSNHDTSAPVSFDAGRIEVQDRADRVVLSGDVDVKQAGLRLVSKRMTVAYNNVSGIEVNRIDASGGVVVTKGTERATGNVGIYDLDRKLITLIGSVSLKQGSNILRGARVIIDLASGRSTIDGRATRNVSGTATSKGRVTGSFTVPQRKKTDQEKKDK